MNNRDLSSMGAAMIIRLDKHIHSTRKDSGDAGLERRFFLRPHYGWTGSARVLLWLSVRCRWSSTLQTWVTVPERARRARHRLAA